MKELLITIHKLYNYKIISLFIFIFFFIQIPFIQKIPDFFQLYKIELPQSYLLRLLTIVIGFSSFILTTFIVIYNVFLKRVRRNSFEVILNNPWINIIFSVFAGSLIFILFSIFIIQNASLNTTITLLYFSSYITFGNLLLQFPLITLSIKHSNSFESVKEIIRNLNVTDIEFLHNPNYHIDDVYRIEDLERNRIILLKDIGVSAIKENDWALPQTILNDLFAKLVKTNSVNTEESDLNKNLFAYIFVSRHFQKIAIEEDDEITVKVSLNNLLRIHTHFIKNKMINILDNPFDENLEDLLRMIVDKHTYYNVQKSLFVSLTDIIGRHIKAIEYSDEQLPTWEYINTLKDYPKESGNDKIKNYWNYIKTDLSEIFLMYLNTQ